MAEKFKLPKRAVIDASFVLSLLLPDEKTEKLARKALNLYQEGRLSFFAPELLKFEVANGLKSAVKRKRVKAVLALKLLGLFLKLKVRYQSVNLTKTLKLALKFNLSVYDASYLVLSRQSKVRLLTLDENLAKLA